MAEPKKALSTPPMVNPVTISNTQGSWAPIPQNSSVQPNGTVQFTSNPTSWVWTMVNNALTPAFQGQTNNYVQCNAGPSTNVTPLASMNNQTITIIPLPTHSNPPQPDIKNNVRGTIRVSSTGVEGKDEK